MMKRRYQTPKAETVALNGQLPLLSDSITLFEEAVRDISGVSDDEQYAPEQAL